MRRVGGVATEPFPPADPPLVIGTRVVMTVGSIGDTGDWVRSGNTRTTGIVADTRWPVP